MAFAGGEVSDDADYRLALDECARFVAQTLPPASGGIRCTVEAGFPESLLNQHAIDNGLDLMAVGTQGRNPVLNLLFGSRSEEHTSELQSLMRISYAVFCLKKKNKQQTTEHTQY